MEMCLGFNFQEESTVSRVMCRAMCVYSMPLPAWLIYFCLTVLFQFLLINYNYTYNYICVHMTN